MTTRIEILERELRKRFAHPRDVLRHMGLDENLLNDDDDYEPTDDDEDDQDDDSEDEDADDTRSQIVEAIQQLAEAFENRDDDAIRECIAQIESLTGGDADDVAADEDRDDYGENREDPSDLAAMERRALAEGSRRGSRKEMAKDAASASSYAAMYGLRQSQPATLFIPQNRPAPSRTNPNSGRAVAMDSRRSPSMSSAELASYDEFFGRKRDVR